MWTGSPWRLLLLLAAACLQLAASQLTDAPLRLPGKPALQRPSGVAAAAAGRTAGSEPEERSGYFSIPGTQRRLFYWYFQARSPTTGAPLSNVPLIAWLQGGPGCSSLFGLFFENGPYTINATQQLVPNPSSSWAAAANLLYIDQPIGTGLSYSGNSRDAQASQLDVAKTLNAFFVAFYKAPEYSHLGKSRLILSGESFAGHYLPAAAAYIKAHTPSLPLAGVAMGSPFVHGPSMYEAYPAFAFRRGFIPQDLYKLAVDNLAACKLQSALCSTLDPSICKSASESCEYQLWSLVINGEGSQLASKNLYNIKDAHCRLPGNCYDELDRRLEQYINANRARLGVPTSLQYRSCSDPPYFNLWEDMTRSYDDLVAALLDNGVSVMIFNGDDDFVCNSEGNQKWIVGLIWSKQAAWASADQQCWAGGTFRRVGPLAFVRVRRAGHMVPMDQPALSLQLIQQWLTLGQPAPCKMRRPRPPASTAGVAAVEAAAVEVEEEEAEGREPGAGSSRRSGGLIRHRRRRWRQEEEEEEEEELEGGEEPGLLVTMLPHPVVQTAPDAAGLAGLESPGVEAAAAGRSRRRSGRVSSPPKAGGEQQQRPADGKQQQAGGKPQQQDGRSRRQSGQKRPAAFPLVPLAAAAAAGARRQEQQRGKRQRTSPAAAAAATAVGVGEAPPLAAVPDSEDQTISEYLRTHPRPLGCSKCRYSKGGCGKCRADAGEAAGGDPGASASPRLAKSTGGQQQQKQQQQRWDEEQQQEVIPSQELLGSRLRSPAVGGRRRSSVGSASGRCFDGCVFLVTGFLENSNGKGALMKALKEHGATVVDEVPKPPQQTPSKARRQSASARQLALVPAVDAVVSDKDRLLTPKYLYACIKGLPVVKHDWVLACAKAKCQLPLRPEDKWSTPAAVPAADQARTAHTPGGVFCGMRVLIHGPKHPTDALAPLLVHAGGTLVSRLEAPPAGSPAGAVERCCDLLLLDADHKAADQAAEEQEVAGLRAAASRLQIPVMDRNGAVTAILDGQPPPSKASPASNQKRKQSGSGAGSAAGAAAEAQLSDGHAAGPAEQPAAAAAAAMAVAAPAAASPRGKNQTRAADGQQQQQQPEPAQRSQISRPQQQQQQQQQHGRSLLAQQQTSGLCWEGNPVDPPASLPKTPYRRYYAAFRKDGERIAVGHCVELAALPGEDSTRIAEVIALWSEGSSAAGGTGGSQDRMFARVRRFYRPQETPFAAMAGPGQLFRTNHIDDRLGLAAVQRRSIVELLPPGQAQQALPVARVGAPGTGDGGGGGSGCHAFSCLLQLDHEQMTLGVLPPECLPDGGAGAAAADPHC